ncbi:MAG: winged helix-turn-helix domain-containing protein, partial [Alphaproteobacteria bacterium]|nr:winged helix-turn-helix domain-containing protein [Alphaproteobacteria bacterium]
MTEFRLDLTDERLWRGDQLVRISNKAFKLLQLLARNPNRLLTKDMILEEVWQDVCVSEGLVKEYVHDLRQALGDDPKNPMFVETVRGRGYRFLGGVDLVDDTAEAAGGSTARNEPPALAVLPFANLTGDERWARFCHGLGDDLVTDLARYPDLTVVANGAGAARLEDDLDVRDLGGELGVSYVLGGSVQASKTSVRVNVKLIETANGNHAWTEQYQRDVGDFLDIQSDIVGHVAAAVGAVGGQIPHRERLRLGRRSPQDMQVYELYLLGQELEARFDQASVLRGVELLQRAVTLDPDYARAWLVLGWLCLQVVLEDWAYDPVEYRALMRQAFLTAAALDPLDPFAAMELAAVRAREGDQ